MTYVSFKIYINVLSFSCNLEKKSLPVTFNETKRINDKIFQRETIEDSKGVIRCKWETDIKYNKQNDKQ